MLKSISLEIDGHKVAPSYESDIWKVDLYLKKILLFFL